VNVRLQRRSLVLWLMLRGRRGIFACIRRGWILVVRAWELPRWVRGCDVTFILTIRKKNGHRALEGKILEHQFTNM
jgi:hypothetical protein